MRHDYDLPSDWASMSQSERSRWMTQDRARRQTMRQETATSARIKHDTERTARRAEAKPGTISVEEHR